jgi:hypothetical protein
LIDVLVCERLKSFTLIENEQVKVWFLVGEEGIFNGLGWTGLFFGLGPFRKLASTGYFFGLGQPSNFLELFFFFFFFNEKGNILLDKRCSIIQKPNSIKVHFGA